MKPRDYKNATVYENAPEQVKNREARNKARLEMGKKVGAAGIKGKDVGHKKALDNGGSNQTQNQKVQSVSSNRAWRKGRKGYSVPNI